jgi:putative membrane protein
MKEIAATFLKGSIIGIANIIPGVSGGTMALVLGIYERLINAIKSISMESLIKSAKLFSFTKESREDFAEEVKRTDFLFLVFIALGAISAIVLLAKVMTIMLKGFHNPTYGFFFGLVLVSAAAPFQMIKKKSLPVFFMILIAAAGVAALSTTMSNDDLIERARAKQELKIKGAESSGEMTLKKAVIFFIAGAVAISAMILPGVSGSFLLLLMGLYFDILRAISQRDLILIGIFSLGCLAGVVLFSRFLAFLLKSFHDFTMAFLVGLVLGSLWVLWPFKATAVVGSETVYLNNILPSSINGDFWFTGGAAIMGIFIVTLMLFIEKRQNG